MVITVTPATRTISTQFDATEWALLVWANTSGGIPVQDLFKDGVDTLLRQIKERRTRTLRTQLEALLKTATPEQLQQAIDLLD